jgi:hypothetical protein
MYLNLIANKNKQTNKIVVARMDEKRNVYRLSVGKPEGRKSLGRPRSRWIDNIKMDLLEMGVSAVDWIGLAQDR